MILHEFFVADENGNQISDYELGTINDFTSFTRASAAARKHSKTNSGLFSVGVCMPSTKYENGKTVFIYPNKEVKNV